jgi:hypothetical protein
MKCMAHSTLLLCVVSTQQMLAFKSKTDDLTAINERYKVNITELREELRRYQQEHAANVQAAEEGKRVRVCAVVCMVWSGLNASSFSCSLQSDVSDHPKSAGRSE